MIIGVDGGALAITDERLKVGVWRVTYNLLRELLAIDGKNEYRLYTFDEGSKEVGEIIGLGKGRVQEVRLPRLAWSTVWLSAHLTLYPVDVYLGLAQSLPSSPSCSIGFIYDVGFLFHPEAYGDSADKLAKQTQQLVNRANDIITISESSKQDILNVYGVAADKVTVAYPGVDELFKTEIASPRRLAGSRNDKKRPYFLFVGSLNKAKDVPLALEAFAMFLKKTKKPYDFLLVGGDYWPDPAIKESIHQYHLEERVKTLGFVADEKLPDYYRDATALIVTSLREGFCLPAAEAMACGTPVVAVDRGSLKKVVGDAGLIASRPNAAEIANLLRQIGTDNALRISLTRRAIKRAKLFSWKKFAMTALEKINAK